MTHRDVKGRRPNGKQLDTQRERLPKLDPEAKLMPLEWRAYALQLQRAQPWTRWAHHRRMRKAGITL